MPASSATRPAQRATPNRGRASRSRLRIDAMDITAVHHIDPFRLRVEFADGTSGVADLESMVHSFAPFAPCRDVALFRQAFIEGGTVAWPGGLDLASERLFELAHPAR